MQIDVYSFESTFSMFIFIGLTTIYNMIYVPLFFTLRLVTVATLSAASHLSAGNPTDDGKNKKN